MFEQEKLPKITMKLLYVFLILFTGKGIFQESQQFKLACLPRQIKITFNDSLFYHADVDVRNATQIHFRGYPQCHAVRIPSGYDLVQDTPFQSCGTSVRHDGEDYVFNNTVVISLNENTTIPFVQIECVYADQYIASSNNLLTPFARTLNFITSRGKLSVKMKLFLRDDFTFDSQLGLRPTISSGDVLYVSVELSDGFGNDELVTTLQSCYVTSSPNYDQIQEENYHHVIIERCSSPDDESVTIYSNGVGAQSNFSFQTFQWGNQDQPLYIHCEVYLCNATTAEECTGTEAFCNGSLNENTNNLQKRSPSRDVDGGRGIISAGPITIIELQNGTSFSTNENRTDVPLDDNDENRTLFLKYVLGSVGAVMGIAGLTLLIFTIMRKRKAAAAKESLATLPSENANEPSTSH